MRLLGKHIMKAKEYVKKLEEEDFSDHSINWLVHNFAKDIVALVDARNAKSPDSFMNIIKEQYQKWRAISRKTDGRLKKDGFFAMIEHIGGPNGKHLADEARRLFA